MDCKEVMLYDEGEMVMNIVQGRLNESNMDKLTRLLVAGFSEDPVISTVFNNEGTKKDDMYRVMKAALKYYSMAGDIYYTEDLSALAIWGKPSTGGFYFKDAFKSNLIGDVLSFAIHTKFSVINRLIKYSKFAEENHKKTISKQHYYLYAVVVDSNKRGQHLGSKLMEYALDKYKAYPCYLENSNDVNINFYNRLGFETKNKTMYNGAPFYFMVKEH